MLPLTLLIFFSSRFGLFIFWMHRSAAGRPKKIPPRCPSPAPSQASSSSHCRAQALRFFFCSPLISCKISTVPTPSPNFSLPQARSRLSLSHGGRSFLLCSAPCFLLAPMPRAAFPARLLFLLRSELYRPAELLCHGRRGVSPATPCSLDARRALLLPGLCVLPAPRLPAPSPWRRVPAPAQPRVFPARPRTFPRRELALSEARSLPRVAPALARAQLTTRPPAFLSLPYGRRCSLVQVAAPGRISMEFTQPSRVSLPLCSPWPDRLGRQARR